MSNNISRLGAIMGIWAHPDDETFEVGGIMHMAVTQGSRVLCVTATKGEAGIQDESRWPAATLSETRARELQLALQELGIDEHHWLGYADGACDRVDEQEVVPQLIELIEQFRPDTILTFPPDGVTGHPDHKAVSRWARSAAALSSVKPVVYFAVDTQEEYDSFLKAADEQFNIYFAIDKPVCVPAIECDISLELPAEVLACKTRALKAVPSQTARMFETMGETHLAQVFCRESLVHSKRAVEYWPPGPK